VIGESGEKRESRKSRKNDTSPAETGAHDLIRIVARIIRGGVISTEKPEETGRHRAAENHAESVAGTKKRRHFRGKPSAWTRTRSPRAIDRRLFSARRRGAPLTAVRPRSTGRGCASIRAFRVATFSGLMITVGAERGRKATYGPALALSHLARRSINLS